MTSVGLMFAQRRLAVPGVWGAVGCRALSVTSCSILFLCCWASALCPPGLTLHCSFNNCCGTLNICKPLLLLTQPPLHWAPGLGTAARLMCVYMHTVFWILWYRPGRFWTTVVFAHSVTAAQHFLSRPERVCPEQWYYVVVYMMWIHMCTIWISLTIPTLIKVGELDTCHIHTNLQQLHSPLPQRTCPKQLRGFC